MTSPTIQQAWAPIDWRGLENTLNRHFDVAESTDACGCLGGRLSLYSPSGDQQRVVIVTKNNSSSFITQEKSGRKAEEDNRRTREAIKTFLETTNTKYRLMKVPSIVNYFPEFIEKFMQNPNEPVTMDDITAIKQLYRTGAPQPPPLDRSLLSPRNRPLY